MFHTDDPAASVEAAFARIHRERMAGIDLLNPALGVAAVGFARHGDDWRGVLVTPWGIHLLLLPAASGWPVPPPHERVFRRYLAGDFAFLANREEDLGDYLICPLVHDMRPYADQETALLAARACLIALDMAPAEAEPVPGTPASPSRRSFLLRKPAA
jgi:[NiFe] hydrogenase assembly HybE family chaperone